MASIFSGLDTEAYDRQYSDWQLITRILSYLRSQLWRVWGVLTLSILVGLVDLVYPFVLVRGVTVLAENPPVSVLWLLVGAILLSFFMSWGFNLVRRRLSARTIGDLILSLRLDAFRAAADHDLSFYDEFKTGRIVSRITSDTQDFAQVITLISDLASQVISVIVLTVILVSINGVLTLLLVACIPLVFIISVSFRQLARYVTRQGNRAMANVNASIRETIAGISVAKNFRQERTIYGEFNTVNAQSYTINLRRGFVLSNIFPVLNAFAGVATGLIVYIGGGIAGAGGLTVGSWYLFINSLDKYWAPVTNLASFWSQFQAGLSAAERVFALIDAEPRVNQVAKESVGKLRGEIEFANLNFKYNTQEVVLKDFALKINAGESVALVGHTGAGKSSLAKLIARFYEFQEGQLLIDGRDIRSFELGQYRQQLGIVSQVPFLFAGTIADNIRYARREATEAEILTLANKIGEGEWLANLPEGLQTPVGERGSKLSMGQRQLVSLMRVLVQRPSIFILDEATASIDPFTESQIQEAVDLILANSTSILIAHRLSTVKAADRIVVLRKGAIIEEGDHEALMGEGGHYAELYNTYFRHQSPSYMTTVEHLT